MKRSLTQSKLLALVLVAMVAMSSFFSVSVSASSGWSHILTFEDNETSAITYDFVPSSAAASAGRTGTATVVDDGTGNKALKVVSKLTDAEGGGNTAKVSTIDNLTLNLPTFAQKTGLVEISWDLKQDSTNYRPFWRMGSLTGTSANCSWRTYYNYLIRTGGSTSNGVGYAKTGYTRFRYLIDMDKTTGNFYAFAPGGTTPFYTGDFSTNSATTIPLSISTYYENGSTGWSAKSGGTEGIYWIDNVSVRTIAKEKLSVVSSSVANNATKVSVETPVSLSFNSDLAPASVTKENIVVKKDGQVVTDYALSQPDAATVVVTPDTTWSMKANYTITVSKAVAPAAAWSNAGNPIDGLASDYVLAFATVSSANDWGYSLTFEDNEVATITYNYVPSSTAAAAGRTGTATAVDDGTGNKALKVVSKLTVAEGGNNTTNAAKLDNLTLNIPTLAQKTGLVEIAWDLKQDSANYRPFFRMGVLEGTSSNCSWRSYGDHNLVKTSGVTSNAFALGTSNYTNFRYVIDLDKTANNFYAFAPGGTTPFYTGNFTSPSTATMKLELYTYYQNGASWVAPSAGDEGIYWIDNVTVQPLTREQLKVTSTSVVANATSVPVETPVSISFNSDVNPATVTQNNIIVKKDGQVVTDYTLSQPDAATVVVTPVTAWSVKANYTITVSDAVAPASEWSNAGNPMEGMASAYVLNFATVSSADEWSYSLTFADNENSAITYNYVPSSTAAAAGRTGTATVVDDGTGNKALKVVSKLDVAEGGNNTTTVAKLDNLTLNFPSLAQKTGLVEIAWDLKQDSANHRPFFRMGVVNGNTNNSWRSYNGKIVQANTTNGFNLAASGYTHFRYVIDLDKNANNFYAFAPGGAAPFYTGTYTKVAGAVKMEMYTYYQNGAGWVAPSAGDEGIYWIDNVTVKPLSIEYLQVTSTSVSNNANNISVANTVDISFNSDIASAMVTKEIFVVKKNGQVVTDYTLSQPSADTVKVTPATAWAEKANYTITVVAADSSSASWNGEGNPIGGLAEDYVLSFNTRAASVVAYDDFENYEINSKLTLGMQDWTNAVVTTAGDEWKIVDDGTGNKVLQFTRAEANLNSTAASRVILPFAGGAISEGVVMVEYDVRLVNNRGNLRNLGSIGSAYLLYNVANDYLYQAVGGGAGWQAKMNTLPDGKVHVKALIDMDNDKSDYYFNGGVTPAQANKTNRKTDPIDSMVFEFSYNATAAPVVSGTGDGVYWIDNISVKKMVAPEVKLYSADGLTEVNAINGGDTVVVGVSAVNNASYDAYVVLKDKTSKKIVAIEPLTEADFSKQYKNVKFTVPQNAGACVAEVYFWDGEGKLMPLCNKIALGY